MPEQIINARVLGSLAECARRVWLDERGKPPPRLRAARRRRWPGYPDNLEPEEVVEIPPMLPWSEAIQATREAMQAGIAFIFGAALEWHSGSLVIQEEVDELRRVSQQSELGRWGYEPLLIPTDPAISEADRWRMDLVLWLIAQIQGKPPSGWFWAGRGPRMDYTFRSERFTAALEQVLAIFESETAPAVFLGSQCEYCGWHSACLQAAQETRNFTLLPTLRRQTRQQLWEAGIRTYDDLVALSAAELQRFHGIGPVNVHEILSLAQAFAGDRPIRRADFPEDLRQPGIMFDLETDLNDGSPWCFGWQVADGPSQVVVVDRACDPGVLRLPGKQTALIVEHSDAAWALLAEAADQVPGCIFHWTDYDRGVLRQSAPARIIDALDTRMHDLHKTYKATATLPIASTSIKTVGAYLGYAWPEGSNAFAAWDDYQRWRLEGDRLALARACAYQRADVEALDVVWRWLPTF